MPRHLHPFRLLLLAALAAAPSFAQILQAPWVDESQQRIERIRKTGVRVILLDDHNEPIVNCDVRFEQLRHAFPFGLRIDKATIAAAPAKEKLDTTPLWRCFNAASIEPATGWPALQPAKDQWDFAAADALIEWTRQRQMSLRFGSIISTDAGRWPGWAAELKGDALAQAAEAHVRQVVQRYGKTVDQFDIVTQLTERRDLMDQLGLAGVRKLHHAAGAATAGPPRQSALGLACVRFDDAFAPDRLQAALRTVTSLREGFIPFDAIAVDVRLHGSIVEAPVTRSLKWLADPGLPVVLTNVEVAGPSEAAAAINLETFLRAAFSHESVQGIFFAGLTAGQLQDPAAALIAGKREGDAAAAEPSAGGRVVDGLIRKLWWTDVTAKTDDIGNARLRIFAGWHRISATLPDGRIAAMEVFIPVSPREKLLVLQPIKGGKAERSAP